MIEIRDCSGSDLINILNKIFDNTRITGIIKCEKKEGDISSKIFIKNNHIVYATSTMYRARFGDLMIKKSIITSRELDAALELQKNSTEQKLIGNILVEMGVISERVIPNLLYHQVESVIYEILSWKEASFIQFDECKLEDNPEYQAYF